MERDEKMIHQEFDLKRELAQQAGSQKSVKDEVKLTKNMTIPDMVKVMMPEIKKALPTVLTPEAVELQEALNYIKEKYGDDDYLQKVVDRLWKL